MKLFIRWFLFLALFAGAAGAGVYALKFQLARSTKIDPPTLVQVQRDTFIHEILDRGSVDSASSVEIRCDVESATGLTIISVVPEGTLVKKGDLLVELDASLLRENVTKQQIAVSASKAKLAQSEADLKTANLTLTEYVEGTFIEEKTKIENEIFAAKEAVETAKNDLELNKKFLERNYISDLAFRASEFAWIQAEKTLDIAESRLKILVEYKKVKAEVQYNAAIKTVDARVYSDNESYQLDLDRLEHLKIQLEKCKIFAPQDGQVIYFIPRWGGEEELIKEGKKVNERQILLRLPDISQMQVKGLVGEASIRLVKVGQKATIRLEAFPNQVFDGIVRVVNDYPEPSQFISSMMSKEYMTTVTILNPPVGIKPGLTAEARIVVTEIPDSLQLPVQAVFEHGGKHYAVTYHEGKWDKIEVVVGPNNDKHIVILDGLKEHDSVVLSAWANRDQIDLPKLHEQEEHGEKMPSIDLKGPEIRQSEMNPDATNRAEGERSGADGDRRRRRPTNESNEPRPINEPTLQNEPPTGVGANVPSGYESPQ